MHRAMAGLATGRIGIAGLGCAAVCAFRKFLHLLLVAFGAFRGRQLGGGGDFVNVSVTGRASLFAERGVNAVRNGSAFVSVASGALHLGNFGGMREFLDRSVTVFATKNTVDAGSVGFGPDGNVLALFRLHGGLPVTSEASFVLLQGLGRRFLSGGRLRTKLQEDQEK